MPHELKNELITIANCLKDLAYGQKASGGAVEHGLPHGLASIAASLEKIEKHLAAIAGKSP